MSLALIGVSNAIHARPIQGQQSPATTPIDSTVVQWLRSRAVPLRSTEADSDLTDLEPLRAIVGDVRVVLMGEATHGTREFFQIKHRLVQYLASELGFTVFAAEAFWSRTRSVDDFLQSGQGDAARALSQLGMWILDTHEVLDMIRWMRGYNEGASSSRRIRFYGADMQDGWSSLRAVGDYLRIVDPPYAQQFSAAVAPLEQIESSYELVRGYSKNPLEQLRVVTRAVGDVPARLDQHHDDYVAKTSPDAWWTARHHARVLAQAEQSWRHPEWPGGPVGAMRDGFMADNIGHFMEREGRAARVAVWAHNGHVARAWRSGEKTMGARLTQRLGKDVLVVGFAFGQGSFQAWDTANTAVMEHTVGPAPERSISATLAAVGLPIFFIDLRQAPATGPVSVWLNSAHPERTVGSQFNPQSEPIQITPAASYDVLVYVDRTTRARPTPTGVRVRRQ